MISANVPSKSNFVQTDSTIPKPRQFGLTSLRTMAFLILVGLVATSSFLTSTASSSNAISPNPKLTGDSNRQAIAAEDSFFTTLNSIGIQPSSTVSLPFMAPQAPITLTTYAGDCTTPKSVFNLQDMDLTVCAKVTGFSPGWVLIWSNAKFVQVQNAPVGNGESTFTLTANSSLGDWRVIAYEPFGADVYALTPFTVVDAANPKADLTISKGATATSVAAGSQVVFTVQVTNLGPSDATSVEIIDTTPANTQFSSFAQVLGPLNTNCSTTSQTVCTIPVLVRGETATFLAAYDVNGGTAGSVIFNTATVSSAVADPLEDNNSSTSSVVVSSATAETCTLDCPANVVVTADTTSGGQPGAFVSFGAASGTGNCGAISNNPQSGSFFTVGTHSIFSTSEFGSSCSFTVTVLDTNPPTITCPADITVTAPEGESEASVNVGTPTVNASGGGTITGVRSDDTPATFDENGNVITPAVVHALTDPYPVGSTGILWKVTDAGGRTATCTQIITVVAFGDRDPVTISCPAHVSLTAPSGTCSATIPAATIGTPTTVPSDSNIHVAARRSDDLPLSDPFPAGITTITWTAVDQPDFPDGPILSTASCTQNVTVTPPGGADTTPPTLNVPPNVIATTSSCTALLDDELGVATAVDTGNCSNSNVNITRTGVPAGFVFPTGTTTIVYTATDAAGNTATGLQLVTVTESPAVPPTITGPPALTVQTGPGATSCGVVVSDGTLGSASASDNCPGVTVTRTGVPAGNLFPVGNTTVTYTATDRSGNTASATQVVTVMDNTPPVITSVSPGGQTDAGSCTATIPNVAAGTVASDNCSVVVTQTPAAGTAVGLGTHTITVRATDPSGNFTEATTTFTVNALQFATKFWLGLKNSDDVGTKFDLRAEVRKNNQLVGSAEIYDQNGGSSGFNNASLRTIAAALSSTGFCSGDNVSVTLLVRVAANSGHVSGTARLWYNDAIANSSFEKVVNGVTTTDYLRKISNVLVLNSATGPPPKLTIDVTVNRNQGGNPWKPFGTWTKAF